MPASPKPSTPEVTALARAAGGISALFRVAVLGHKAPKSKLDLQAHAQVLSALAALTGAVNKVGNNINQIAKEDNMGRDLRLNSLVAEWKEFKELFDRDQLEYRQLHMRSMGLEPNRKFKD